jgi:hypothetical protein
MIERPVSERIERIKAAVQVLHRCSAVHVESVPVVDMSGPMVLWEGVVEVFEIEGHEKSRRCFAWSRPDGKETRFVTFLEIPPVVSAETAVRAALASRKR